MMWGETGHNEVHGSFTPSNELPLETNRCEFGWAVSNPSEALKRDLSESSVSSPRWNFVWLCASRASRGSVLPASVEQIRRPDFIHRLTGVCELCTDSITLPTIFKRLFDRRA